MPRVLIAGCGYVGSAAADLFRGANWEVEGWTRSAPPAEESGATRAVDISRSDEVESAAGDFDVVIHCASSRGGGAESYRRIYFEGARTLLSVLRPRLFIFTSSTSVYAQTDGQWVDEQSPADPANETSRILRETEEFVRKKGGVIARLAGIYGPGRSALLRKLLSGDARIEGDGGRFLNRVHRDDTAAALLLLTRLPNEQRSGGIFNVTDDEPSPQRSCYTWLAAKLGRPVPPTVAVPATRKRGVSNKRVSNRKLRALGWELKFPSFIDGMEKSVLPAAAAASLRG